VIILGHSLYCGIDEAGRGPVIGPMAVACIVVNEKTINALEKLGVRDSKTLLPSTRIKLYKRLGFIAEKVHVRIVSPPEIDKAVFGKTFKNLNDLEAFMAASLIAEVYEPDVSKIFVDSPDINPERYKLRILKHLNKLGLRVEPKKLICENKAESKYVIVAAASIIAKVRRDLIIEKLKTIYGDIGSGYPSDPVTREFLKRAIKAGKTPPIIRFSWKTLKRYGEYFAETL